MCGRYHPIGSRAALSAFADLLSERIGIRCRSLKSAGECSSWWGDDSAHENSNQSDPVRIAAKRSRKRSVALKLTVIARQLRVTFDQSAEQSGLTRAQWTLIATVARNPGATQRTIANALEVMEITAGRLVNRLCKEGYLQRRENRNDRRAYGVYLTRAAQPLLDKLDELAKIHEVAIFAGFKARDIEKLDAYLDLIARNVSRIRTVRAVAK
jgi:MarR family transcriptional regulator for hemolysin